MRLLLLPLALALSAGCVDLSAITGSPQAARHAPECGAIQMVTVADSTLPENARQFYPQVDVSIAACR